MKKLLSLSVLLSLTVFAQDDKCINRQPKSVGINTTCPTATFDVNGNVRFRKIETGLDTDSIVVTNNGHISKIALSSIVSGNSKIVCPTLNRNQSNEYSLHFVSDSSVPNPNNPLIIETLNFTQSGPFIRDNKYFYSWSNASGKPLNINKEFSVTFGTTKCIYKK